jgi:hypothetical protein
MVVMVLDYFGIRAYWDLGRNNNLIYRNPNEKREP